MTNIQSASPVLPTLFTKYIALAQPTYPADLAYKMLEEVQQKIYSVYPKVKESEEESIAGARIFVSDICQRYNSLITREQSKEDKEAEEIAERRAEEFANKLKSNMERMILPVEESKVHTMLHTRSFVGNRIRN